MTPVDFERDLEGWLDGELPPARAAEMQAAADASPELTRRVEFERRFRGRVRNALTSDADEDVVRAMAARAAQPRVLRLPRAAWRAAAAVLVVAAVGCWWFCVPPFECAYLQALERAAHDAEAKPLNNGRDFVISVGLPAKLGDAVAAPPLASTMLEVHGRRFEGVRLDYVAGDGATTLHVVTSVAATDLHPSIRRRVEKDGEVWWTRVHAGERTWAFQSAARDVYAVSGPATAEATVWNAAKALRAAVR